MDEFAVGSTLEAGPGKGREAEEFLHRAKALIDKERGTSTHVHGAAAALVAAAVETWFVPPEIITVTILTAKVPGGEPASRGCPPATHRSMAGGTTGPHARTEGQGASPEEGTRGNSRARQLRLVTKSFVRTQPG